MSSPAKMIMALGVAGALTLASMDAEAQRIRTYGDDGGQQSTVHLPGAPAPQQQAATTQPSSADEEGGFQESAGTYRITMHGVAGQQQRRQEYLEMLNWARTDLYRGIIPGERDSLPHLARARRDGERTDRPNQVTWIGFQPESDRTRVFFQSPRPMQYRIQDARDGNDLVVIFENTRIPARNFSRFIDASYFDRAVERIEASQTRDGNVEVRLTMRDNVRPQVSRSEEYLYFDFAHLAEESDDSGAEAATNR